MNAYKPTDDQNLRVDTYLDLSLTVLAPLDIDRVRSEIVDGAVRRRVMAEADPHASEDTRALLYRLGRLEEKVEDLLEVLKHRRSKPLASHQVSLGINQLHLYEGGSVPGLQSPLYVFVKMVLPSHHHEPILCLAQVLPHDQTMDRTLQFIEIAEDQIEWIARYLIHRQREQARQKALPS